MRSRSEEGAIFDSKTILIVDESTYAVLDLSEAIEECEGRVVGPVTTLSETLIVLESTDLCGAVVDCDLVDAERVLQLLVQRRVPLVVQTCASIPRSLDVLDGNAAVLVRPVNTSTILEALVIEIGRLELRASNKLGSNSKEV